MDADSTFLGIDIGGTKVAMRAETAGVAQDGGGGGGGRKSWESTFRWPPPEGPAADLAVLAEHLDALVRRLDGPLAGVGIALPATLDPVGRVTAWPGRPSWTGLDLAAALREVLPGTEVRCADDGDLAAMAEAAALDCPDVVYLGVGTGIGGGIVLGGRPYPGPGRGSCEIGHLVVDRTGPLCDCGRRGCVQALASGPATLRRAAVEAAAEVDFATLRQAWSDRLDWAVRVVEESCAVLAAAAVSVGELTHPAYTVLGGGFADGLPGFVAEVDRQAQKLSRPGHSVAPVRAAALGGLSSLRGALLLARGEAA
ncbi:ROK family protein [Kitasatospora mediocidica]|uniref:ROK family protein n=1 Tax=Kitasatospora mediocidica TaxID=58352 RepID=UPI000566FCA9|nr:ROK family protein [Kitasatospora mediocidica]